MSRGGVASAAATIVRVPWGSQPQIDQEERLAALEALAGITRKAS